MKHARPRSADLGGLHLATAGSGFGAGWLGHSCELHTRFAELLSDMYNETLNAVNERDAEFAPTDLPVETRTRLINALDSWNFEPHKLPDEEVLSCTMILFEALFRIEGMIESVGVTLDQIYPLIHHLRRIYRWENTYHNFEHALDVLQASYTFLRLAGMVPSVTILLEDQPPMWSTQHVFDNGQLMTCLRPQDLFVIYIAAIGHDVAHPGFTNVFMKNAQAPLSVVFDNKSPLEQMHISLLLRVMRHHGLGPLLDDSVDDSGQRTRKLLSETVLATDMSVHKTFMENFRSLLDCTEDFELCRRQLLICQAIIKCADISNPYRPYHVAKHWAEALMGEWTSQAMLEKCMRLPPTVQASDDPLTEAKGQIFFINAFAKPLLELIVEAVPELDPLLQQCKSNLSRWEIRRGDLELELQNESTESTISEQIPGSPGSTRSSTRRDDYLTAFPLTLPAVHPYRSLVNLHSSVSLEQLTADRRSCADDESDVSTDYGEERISDRLQSVTDTKLIWPSSANAGGVYQAKSEEGDLSTPPPSSYESNSGSAESIPPSPDTDSISESGSCLFSPSGVSPPSASGSTSESVSNSASTSPPTDRYVYPNIVPGSGGLDAPPSSAGSGLSSRSRSRTNSAMSDISKNENGSGIQSTNPSPSKKYTSKTSSVRSSVQLNGHGHRSRDSTCSTSTSQETYDAHRAIRAAADSAGAGLRKKRSMMNRTSWGPNVLGVKEDGDGGIKSKFPTSMPLAMSLSLSPPPMKSPTSLAGASGQVEAAVIVVTQPQAGV
ncbi:high-affinity phosphodiesterase [Moniliophthora roreri]|uniref:Phosphodiesterase n=1 Tax=Moniliophthora roreri TaxID=221103 RepID=A0A0W0G733_MONRR|nr:high-affinity phosphodiesterase [Moniliophthora roreri]